MPHGAPQNKVLLKHWLLAIRPKTLPASVAPVVVGSAIAHSQHGFTPLPALASLAVALLLQIAVNLANDYFDHIKGVDTEERLGPVRVTQSGLIPPARVRAAMVIALILSLLPGMYLILRGGWPLAGVAMASIAAALAYSGGPYPLASHGLGDICVFIFFGPVAVCGTYYVQTLQVTGLSVWVGVIFGLLITAILVVNNLRDIKTDGKSGKRTLAVILGTRGTQVEYIMLLLGAYVLPFVLIGKGLVSPWVLLCYLSFPLAVKLCREVWQNPAGAGLNMVLAKTARLTLIYSFLLSLALLLPNLLVRLGPHYSRSLNILGAFPFFLITFPHT